MRKLLPNIYDQNSPEGLRQWVDRTDPIRVHLPWARGSTPAKGYMGMAGVYTTASVGYVAMHDGSITGQSVCAAVTVETAAGTIDFEVQINGVAQFVITITTAGTGIYTKWMLSPLNLIRFQAGDLIQVMVNFISFTGTLNPIFDLVELQYDPET